MTLYGNYGIFLIMGNAGFVSSTVVEPVLQTSGIHGQVFKSLGSHHRGKPRGRRVLTTDGRLSRDCVNY